MGKNNFKIYSTIESSYQEISEDAENGDWVVKSLLQKDNGFDAWTVYKPIDKKVYRLYFIRPATNQDNDFNFKKFFSTDREIVVFKPNDKMINTLKTILDEATNYEVSHDFGEKEVINNLFLTLFKEIKEVRQGMEQSKL